MDIPQVLDRLRPGQDWGPCSQTHSTYTDLARTWRGTDPVPTLQEMEAAWVQIQAEAPGKLAVARRTEARAILADLEGRGAILRAVALAMLDEINLIRARLVPPLQPRTASQIMAAVQLKLDSGAADT